MKRYKIDLSSAEFFGMVRNGAIDENASFEAYDVADPVALKMSVKPSPKAATTRKPRRTKAQIEADNLAKLAASPVNQANAATDANQRAFPWKDDSMNTPTDKVA